MKTRFSFLIAKSLLLILFIFSIHNLIYTQVTPGSVVEEEIDPYLATPAADYIEEMPVVIVRYLPTLDGINIDVAQATDYYWLHPITIDDLEDDIDIFDKRVKFSLEEGSKFRGYDNGNAVPYLGYRVIKYLSVYRQMAISDFPVGDNDEYQPDYNQEFDELNLTQFITDNNVKEVWLWHGTAARPNWPSYDPEIHGNITEWITGPESNMSSPTTGDISNSLRYPDDIPIVDHTFVVYCYDFRRTQAEATHNHGHQIESMHNFTAIQQDGTSSMFVENFCGWVGTNYTVPPIGRAGDTHHPANTDVDYDYYNTTFVESDIQDWNPLGGPVTLVNCNTWGDIDYNWPGTAYVEQKIENQWYIYWYQSIPGYNNEITFDSYVMTNWWQHIADWDSCYNNNIGLYATIPPIADFEADNTTPIVDEMVEFTDISTFNPTSWSWSFNPSTITYVSGTDANSQHPEVQFNASGLYTVELTATNDGGSDTETKSDYIEVILPPPIANFEANNTAPLIDETVIFTDLSTFNPTSWSWSFNPSTVTYVSGTDANSQHPEVQFNAIGLYTVELTVANASGSDTETKSDYIGVILPPPIANFEADNLSPTIEETVTFTDLSTNNPTSWLWTFTPTTITYMGGTDASSQNPQVRFDTPGAYDVSLTATNAGGADNEIKTAYINATDPPPVADFVADNTAPTTDETVTFTDLSNNTPTSWVWSFSPSTITYMEGTNASSQHPKVRFDDTGAYTVELTATNAGGSDTEIKTDYINATVVPPVADFVADNTTPYIGETVTFTDLSTNTPTSWLWEFTPSTLTYVSGTNQNSQNPQVQFNVSGLYTVELTATNGGGSGTETKTGYINAGDVFEVIATATPDIICLGESTFLQSFPSGGTENYTFLWTSDPSGFTSNDQNVFAYPETTTTYTVEVDDGNQTISANVLVTVNPLPNITLGNWPEILCHENEPPVQLSADPPGGIYSGTGVSATGLFDPEIAPLGWNVITYTYEDAMGCENTAIDSIFIDDCVGVIGLEKDRLNLVVFPNPFGSSVAMEYELQKPEMISLIIYNKQGKQVYQTQENQPQGEQQLIWNAERFAEGVYYYRLQVGNSVANGKMVKVR